MGLSRAPTIRIGPAGAAASGARAPCVRGRRRRSQPTCERKRSERADEDEREADRDHRLPPGRADDAERSKLALDRLRLFAARLHLRARAGVALLASLVERRAFF